jgi:ATP-binding cassette, subfamily G (WHITE), member 2, PDR
MTSETASGKEEESLEESQYNVQGTNSLLQQWIARKQQKTTARIALAFRNLNVHGFSSSSQYQHTVATYISLLPRFFVSLVRREDQEKVQILQNFNGLVRSGEMLLVLGRPGSGCSTFLKTLAGDTHGIYLGDKAAVNYQG